MAKISESHKAMASDKEVRDAIVRRLLKVGCACAPDLANELKPSVSRETVAGTLAKLHKEGIVRVLKDRGDNRQYDSPYQTVYELVS